MCVACSVTFGRPSGRLGLSAVVTARSLLMRWSLRAVRSVGDATGTTGNVVVPLANLWTAVVDLTDTDDALVMLLVLSLCVGSFYLFCRRRDWNNWLRLRGTAHGPCDCGVVGYV